MIKIEELESYKNYGRVLSLSNGVISAYVTLDVGPRIIRFGYLDGQNFMNDDTSNFEPKTDEKYEALFGKGKAWNNFGGHRIWLSPESYPETYYPDDSKVEYEVTENGAVFSPKEQRAIGIKVTLELVMDDDDANMLVKMRVKNIGEEAKRFAVWGLTVSAKNGTLIVPMNTNNTGLLANRNISVWPYTKLNDERLYFGRKYVTLKQNPNNTDSLKLGFDLNCGTVYYVLGGDIFSKSYETNHPDGTYPDNNCSFETYTNQGFLEIESLSELKDVKAAQETEHTERWSLYKKPCEIDFESDESIDNLFEKL